MGEHEQTRWVRFRVEDGTEHSGACTLISEGPDAVQVMYARQLVRIPRERLIEFSGPGRRQVGD